MKLIIGKVTNTDYASGYTIRHKDNDLVYMDKQNKFFEFPLFHSLQDKDRIRIIKTYRQAVQILRKISTKIEKTNGVDVNNVEFCVELK